MSSIRLIYEKFEPIFANRALIDIVWCLCIDRVVYMSHILNARQNGENVNPFRAIASVAGDRSVM